MRAQAANATDLSMEPMARENDDMMAGSAIYRRIQTKSKKPSLAYVVPVIAVLALGAGAAFYALKPAPAPHAAVSQQQAAAAAQQATTAADQADAAAKSATLSSEQAQAKKVAATAQPPAPAVTADTRPIHVRTAAPVVHKAPVRMTVGTRPAPPSSAASAGVDTSSISPPPAPVTATPVTPVAPPVQTTVQPAPVTPPATTQVAPAPVQPTPATPDQTPSPN